MDLSLIVFLFAIGVIFGSFVNVLIYRIPRNISIFYPPSSCVKCETRIKWYENIPIISFLFLKGRCTYCGAQISISYPLVEVFVGIVFIILFNYALSPLHFIFIAFLMVIFISMGIIDFKHYILPDKLLISGALLSILYYVYLEGLTVVNYIWDACISFSVLFLLRFGSTKLFKKEGLGIGDLKLGALMGFLLGWKASLIAIFFGFNLAALTILILYPVKGIKKKSYIPFGPFMLSGMLVYLIWGNKIVHWYMQYAVGQ